MNEFLTFKDFIDLYVFIGLVGLVDGARAAYDGRKASLLELTCFGGVGHFAGGGLRGQFLCQSNRLAIRFMPEGRGIGKAPGLDSGFRGNFLHFRNHLVLAEIFKILDDLLGIIFWNAADVPAEFTMP